MSDLPLLLFPTPRKADRSNRPHVPPHIKTPDLERQKIRLTPMFSLLQKTFETLKAKLQQNSAGIEPEQVLVLETIGRVEEFAKAVKRINGFEWMGELLIDEIAPDTDFHVEGDEKKQWGDASI